MHRHGHSSLLPIIRSQHPTRSASTAAKLKTSEYTSSSDAPINRYSNDQASPQRRLTGSSGVRKTTSFDNSLPAHNSYSFASSSSSRRHVSDTHLAFKAKPLQPSPPLNSLDKWTHKNSAASPPFPSLNKFRNSSPSTRLPTDIKLRSTRENIQAGYSGSQSREGPRTGHLPSISREARVHSQFKDTRIPSKISMQTLEASQDAEYNDFVSENSNNSPEEALIDNSQRHVRLRKDNYRGRGSLLVGPSLGHAARPVRQTHSVPLVKLKKGKSNKPRFIKTRSVDVYIPSTVSVGVLSRLLNVKMERLRHKMEMVGITDQANYDYVLTAEYAALLAEEYGRHPIVDDEAAFDLFPPGTHVNPSSLPSRPPIVTIMGHVDHGKTTLLDTLRTASVAKSEAGGITQHIGAFSVPVKQCGDGPQSITFLDTPGHAAFSAMRARGANVTDIIVLVVAADDGIMPQTKEVIDLYKKDEGKLGLVVAINKIDKAGADIDSIERALLAEGIQLEAYGGEIPAVHVSGLTGQGLPELVETLSMLAEMHDLRAENEGRVYGQILESQVQQGLGFVGTVLVLRGSLKIGSHIISGLNHAKVRRMTDSNDVVVKTATPGMAVTVSGWKTLPKAGDDVIEGADGDIKKALANRIRQSEVEASLADVDAINEARRQDREQRASEGQSNTKTENDQVIAGPKELRLIIKADVSGSAEAVQGALDGIGNKIAKCKIISSGVGDISESDVMMAKASNATLVGFSVSISRSIQNLAVQSDVPICSSSIIYRLVEDVRDRVRSLLPVIIETKVTGEATVLQLFDIHLKDKTIKKVAGCRVTNGLVEKSKSARIVRSGETIHEGLLDTLRQLKKDVTEVRKGIECGLSCVGFSDIREGDLIQMYEKIGKPGVL